MKKHKFEVFILIAFIVILMMGIISLFILKADLDKSNTKLDTIISTMNDWTLEK